MIAHLPLSFSLSLSVCECVWERERERERGGRKVCVLAYTNVYFVTFKSETGEIDLAGHPLFPNESKKSICLFSSFQINLYPSFTSWCERVIEEREREEIYSINPSIIWIGNCFR